MSIQGNAGAEAAAAELRRFIERLMKQEGFRKLSGREVAEAVKVECEQIEDCAKRGWY